MANQTSANQEIDLSQVSRKMKSYLYRANDAFFDGILFIKRNIIILLVLFAAGVALGYWQDKRTTLYAHNIDVMPNFGSVDYLYNQVEEVSSRLVLEDTTFIRKTGISGIAWLELEPNIDLFGFINDPANPERDNDRSYQLFKILAENGDMGKTMEEHPLSRNYKTHRLTVYTGEPITGPEQVINPLLDFLNSDPYFDQVREISQKNLEMKIRANDSLIGQIDAILNDFPQKGGGGTSLMYFGEDRNTELNIIESKQELLREQARNRINELNYSRTIKEHGIALNIKTHKGLSGKMKFILPVLLIFIFVSLAMFRKYYRKQVAKRKIIITNE